MKRNYTFGLGVCAPLFYRLIYTIQLYTEYSEQYAKIRQIVSSVLLILPGIAIAVLLSRDTFKEYLKSFGLCFLTTAIVVLMYELLRINAIISVFINGTEEFSLGDALLFICTYIPYLVSYFIGGIIAGIVTIIRKKRASLNN